MRSLPCLLLVLVACSSTPETRRDSPGSQATDPCSPAALGLPNAKRLEIWQPPAGCTIQEARSPVWLAAEADVAQTISCPPGAALGVDFSKTALVITTRTLSPATVSVDALDDGTTITFVSRMRAACPNEPPPMPVPATLAFRAVPGGVRAWAEASCTVETRCP